MKFITFCCKKKKKKNKRNDFFKNQFLWFLYRLSLATLSRMSKPRFRTKKVDFQHAQFTFKQSFYCNRVKMLMSDFKLSGNCSHLTIFTSFRQEFPLINRGWSLPVNSWRMAAPSLTTTSRRSPPSIWSSAWGEGPRRGRRRTTPPPKRTSTRRRRSSWPSSSTTRWELWLHRHLTLFVFLVMKKNIYCLPI